MKEEVIISGRKLWDEEDFAGQEDEAFQPEETTMAVEALAALNVNRSLSTQEAGWCWGEAEGKGKGEDYG